MLSLCYYIILYIRCYSIWCSSILLLPLVLLLLLTLSRFVVSSLVPRPKDRAESKGQQDFVIRLGIDAAHARSAASHATRENPDFFPSKSTDSCDCYRAKSNSDNAIRLTTTTTTTKRSPSAVKHHRPLLFNHGCQRSLAAVAPHWSAHLH
jgi:hypothetical protein